MLITFFVDWENQVVLNPLQFREKLAAAADELFDDDDYLAEWLDRNYSTVELFFMDKDEKAEVRERFRAYCEENAESALSDDGEDYEQVSLAI